MRPQAIQRGCSSGRNTIYPVVFVAMVHFHMSLSAWVCAVLLVNAHVPLAMGFIFSRANVQLELALLNFTVGGRLHQATPWELPCFSEYNGELVAPNTTACAAIQADYTSPFERVKHFGAYMMVRARHSVLPSDKLWTRHCCSLNGPLARCKGRRESAF